MQVPYTFNSIDAGVKYYYNSSNVTGTVILKSYNITLPAATNVHIEVGYNFFIGYPQQLINKYAIMRMKNVIWQNAVVWALDWCHVMKYTIVAPNSTEM